MHPSVRSGLGALLLLPLASSAPAQPPADSQPRPTGAAKATAPVRNPRLDEVLATINGEKLTRGEVLAFLSRLEPEPGKEKQVYKYAVDTLTNTKLLNQFLTAHKVVVPEKEINAELERTKQEIQTRQGTDLATALAQNNITIPDLRAQISQFLRWKTYLMAHASDAELAKFIERNRDIFAKTQVRAAHILIVVDPDAPAAEKEKARQKLLDIKKDIQAGKISFSEAANKYSEDRGNKENLNGGDLGFFERKRPYLEAFSAAAFQMKPGEISDPVETDYGYHLIQVSDRKEGTPVEPQKLLNQFREQILNQYAFELQSQIVADERKKARIDLKPMPADILPPTPVVVPTLTAPGGSATPKAAPPQ